MSTGHCPISHQPSTSLLCEDFWATVSFWENGGCKGKPWQTLKNSSRKYNSYKYCELIFLVKLALQIYVFFYHISSSHNANTHIRAVFQRAATIVKSWYWSWSVGKPCQISNQHHCHHHHQCQPTLSSPKSFQYKTYIFNFADIWTPDYTFKELQMIVKQGLAGPFDFPHRRHSLSSTAGWNFPSLPSLIVSKYLLGLIKTFESKGVSVHGS